MKYQLCIFLFLIGAYNLDRLVNKPRIFIDGCLVVNLEWYIHNKIIQENKLLLEYFHNHIYNNVYFMLFVVLYKLSVCFYTLDIMGLFIVVHLHISKNSFIITLKNYIKKYI